MAETPTLSLSFDKPLYYVGEIAQVSISGATPNALYTIALKNSQKNELLYIVTFQAPSEAFTIPLRITYEFVSAYWDRIILIGATASYEISKPAVVIEGGGGRLEDILVDKTTYRIGEYVQWKAINLQLNRIYQVALILDGGKYISAPERDRWIATSNEKSGQFEIGTNISPGNYKFGLLDVTYGFAVLIAYKNITVTTAPPPPPPGGDWWSKIIEWIKNNPLVVAIILLLAYLLFFKK